MEFEETLKTALDTLQIALIQHERQKTDYEQTITRINNVLNNVPPAAQLPLGDILGILRRHIPIQELSVFLSLDLKMLLSPPQVVEIVQTARARIISQIKEIQKEIADVKSLAILNLRDREIVNEEGLPIKEIREEVNEKEQRETESRKGVSFEEAGPIKTYTMDEIDKMMDEAMEEEQAELEESRKKSSNLSPQQKKEDMSKDTARGRIRAGDGLEVGTVSGEELLAKLMDDSKRRYDPINDTWMDNEDELTGDDEDYDSQEEEEDEDEDEEEESEEEDQYGRTRGHLIPPGLYKGLKQEKGVKFASFERPPSPTKTQPTDKPIKSVLKKTSSATHDTAPLTSTRFDNPVATEIVERGSKEDDTYKYDTTGLRKISRFKAARQGI